MFKRKQNKRKSNKRKFFNALPPSIQEEPLSDIWYNNTEICKVLGMHISTVKRRRRNGSLIASKKFGKISFNDYHVQQYLRGGLSKVVVGMTYLVNMLDSVVEVAMVL